MFETARHLDSDFYFDNRVHELIEGGSETQLHHRQPGRHTDDLVQERLALDLEALALRLGIRQGLALRRVKVAELGHQVQHHFLEFDGVVVERARQAVVEDCVGQGGAHAHVFVTEENATVVEGLVAFVVED